jgi:hypothetical protein
MIEFLATLLIFYVAAQAFLTYYSNAPVWLKLVIFPILLIALILGKTIFTDGLGAPIDAIPESDFQYIHHAAGQGGETIFVWIHTKERGNRLHVIPYSREVMEELEKAKRGVESEPQYGRFESENGKQAFVSLEQSQFEPEEVK